MSYLLDTCTLSEFARRRPDVRVVDWFERQNEEELFLSAIVLGELAKGIAQLEENPKKHRLHSWLYTDLCNRFEGRILPVTPAVATEWGTLSGSLRRQGVQLGMADGLIAATALVHSLVVVTRNTADITPAGIPVFNPWED